MSRSPVFIVGAGGFGREIAAWLQNATVWTDECEFAGFLDDNPRALDGYFHERPIVAAAGSFEPRSDQRFVCGIGNPRQKLKVCRSLEQRGARFLPLINRTAVVGPGCRIGTGVVLCHGVLITTNVTIGDFAALNAYASVGHDASIGQGCTVSSHCDVTGGAAMLEGASLGSHASLLPGAVVGEYATVGAGSVVLRRVRPGTTVFGVPARSITDESR